MNIILDVLNKINIPEPIYSVKIEDNIIDVRILDMPLLHSEEVKPGLHELISDYLESASLFSVRSKTYHYDNAGLELNLTSTYKSTITSVALYIYRKYEEINNIKRARLNKDMVFLTMYTGYFDLDRISVPTLNIITHIYEYLKETEKSELSEAEKNDRYKNVLKIITLLREEHDNGKR